MSTARHNTNLASHNNNNSQKRKLYSDTHPNRVDVIDSVDIGHHKDTTTDLHLPSTNKKQCVLPDQYLVDHYNINDDIVLYVRNRSVTGVKPTKQLYYSIKFNNDTTTRIISSTQQYNSNNYINLTQNKNSDINTQSITDPAQPTQSPPAPPIQSYQQQYESRKHKLYQQTMSNVLMTPSEVARWISYNEQCELYNLSSIMHNKRKLNQRATTLYDRLYEDCIALYSPYTINELYKYSRLSGGSAIDACMCSVSAPLRDIRVVLQLHIYQHGFSINDEYKNYHPYTQNRLCQVFIESIDNGVQPSKLWSMLHHTPLCKSIQYYNGCVVIQTYDYRLINDSNQHKPIMKYHLLQPTNESIQCDIMSFTYEHETELLSSCTNSNPSSSHSPTQQLLCKSFELESRILTYTKHNLCLQPDIRTHQIMNLVYYNTMKHNVKQLSKSQLYTLINDMNQSIPEYNDTVTLHDIPKYTDMQWIEDKRHELRNSGVSHKPYVEQSTDRLIRVWNQHTEQYDHVYERDNNIVMSDNEYYTLFSNANMLAYNLVEPIIQIERNDTVMDHDESMSVLPGNEQLSGLYTTVSSTTPTSQFISDRGCIFDPPTNLTIHTTQYTQYKSDISTDPFSKRHKPNINVNQLILQYSSYIYHTRNDRYCLLLDQCMNNATINTTIQHMKPSDGTAVIKPTRELLQYIASQPSGTVTVDHGTIQHIDTLLKQQSISKPLEAHDRACVSIEKQLLDVDQYQIYSFEQIHSRQSKLQFIHELVVHHVPDQHKQPTNTYNGIIRVRSSSRDIGVSQCIFYIGTVQQCIKLIYSYRKQSEKEAKTLITLTNDITYTNQYNKHIDYIQYYCNELLHMKLPPYNTDNTLTPGCLSIPKLQSLPPQQSPIPRTHTQSHVVSSNTNPASIHNRQNLTPQQLAYIQQQQQQQQQQQPLYPTQPSRSQLSIPSNISTAHLQQSQPPNRSYTTQPTTQTNTNTVPSHIPQLSTHPPPVIPAQTYTNPPAISHHQQQPSQRRYEPVQANINTNTLSREQQLIQQQRIAQYHQQQQQSQHQYHTNQSVPTSQQSQSNMSYNRSAVQPPPQSNIPHQTTQQPRYTPEQMRTLQLQQQQQQQHHTTQPQSHQPPYDASRGNKLLPTQPTTYVPPNNLPTSYTSNTAQYNQPNIPSAQSHQSQQSQPQRYHTPANQHSMHQQPQQQQQQQYPTTPQSHPQQLSQHRSADMNTHAQHIIPQHQHTQVHHSQQQQHPQPPSSLQPQPPPQQQYNQSRPPPVLQYQSLPTQPYSTQQQQQQQQAQRRASLPAVQVQTPPTNQSIPQRQFPTPTQQSHQHQSMTQRQPSFPIQSVGQQQQITQQQQRGSIPISNNTTNNISVTDPRYQLLQQQYQQQHNRNANNNHSVISPIANNQSTQPPPSTATQSTLPYNTQQQSQLAAYQQQQLYAQFQQKQLAAQQQQRQ